MANKKLYYDEPNHGFPRVPADDPNTDLKYFRPTVPIFV